MRRTILTSTLPLLISVVLIFIVGGFGIPKLSDLRSQISSAQVDRNTLTQKLNILRNVSQAVSSGANVVTLALPDQDPALLVLSQIKTLSSSQGLSVSNLKAGNEIKDPNGLSRVDVTFDLTGSRAQIFSFVKSIANIAPITLTDKVKIIESGGGAIANITVKSYWAPLPKNLPNITAPIDNLTPDELNTINDLNNLIKPSFLEVPPSETGGKADPFGQ